MTKRLNLKVIIIFLIGLLLTSIIYAVLRTDQKNYLALGDSIARGVSPHGGEMYSYNDYVVEYLRSKNLINNYYRDFAISDLRTNDLIKMIQDNYEIRVKDRKVTIQQALAKADIVTVSVGSYDLYNHLGITNGGVIIKNNEELNSYFRSMFTDLDNLLKTIKKYTIGRVIVIGFYNPQIDSSEDIDSIFKFIDNSYEKIAEKNNCDYISLNESVSKNLEFLPNMDNIHMNYKGQKLVSEKIIKLLKI